MIVRLHDSLTVTDLHPCSFRNFDLMNMHDHDTDMISI